MERLFIGTSEDIMYPFRTHLRNSLLLILVITSFIYVPNLAIDVESVAVSDNCVACFIQRDANLPYIIRRAIHESGPDENQTFGHCFVCLRCPQEGNEQPIPYCRGWWPADPDGGDYDGDGGVINSDETEQWDRMDCISISKTESQQIRTVIYNYGTNYDYQVLNKGGRSCLGYCADVAEVIQLPHQLSLGNYTIPGDMYFPSAQWSSTVNSIEPWYAVEGFFSLQEKDSFTIEITQ